MNRRLRTAVRYPITLAVVIAIAVMMAAAVSAKGPVYSIHGAAIPDGAPEQNATVHGHHFSLSLDPETKIATWCMYRATEAEGAGRNSIARNWLHGLRDLTLEDGDYNGSRYNRGHLAPLATFSSSYYAFELNWTGNIAPQTAELNQGPWSRLEAWIRELTDDHDHVDVIVGPLYELRMDPLPRADEPHRVPSHFWAVVRPKGQPPVGYVMPQACDRRDPIASFVVPVADIERRSGLSISAETD